MDFSNSIPKLKPKKIEFKQLSGFQKNDCPFAFKDKYKHQTF